MKPIPECQDYAVTKDGRVWSKKRERFLKPYFNKVKGLQQVCLSIKGVKRMAFVHRLVAQAYVPNPENKVAVKHKNGNHTDNRGTNLKWITMSESARAAFKAGTRKVTNQFLKEPKESKITIAKPSKSRG
jgi:hypothetical protein